MSIIFDILFWIGSAILGLLGLILGAIVIWLFFFPVTWILSTPFILVIAAFRRCPYVQAVGDGYRAVTDFWMDQGKVFSRS